MVSDGSGRCPSHQRAKYKVHKAKVTEDYKERNRFYQRSVWKQARGAHLQSEPLCRTCRETGKLVSGSIVDHVVAIADGGAELDDSNLQTLCTSCHNKKTGRERKHI